MEQGQFKAEEDKETEKTNFIDEQKVKKWQELFQKTLNDITTTDNKQDLDYLINQNCFSQQPVQKQENFKQLFKLAKEDKEFYPTINQMAKLALELPRLFDQTTIIPFLVRGQEQSVNLSQKQVFCLLANNFLCSTPLIPIQLKTPLPHNLSEIFQKGKFKNRDDQIYQQLRCIYYSLKQMIQFCQDSQKDPKLKRYINAVISFERKKQSYYKKIEDVDSNLTQMIIEDERGIFQINDGIQVDFANKFIGGGVVGSGCVQQEIYFSVAPENLVSRLFCEVMKDEEAIYIIGVDTYCNYTGYRNTFKYEDLCNDIPGLLIKDEEIYDSSNRKKRCMSAIDALRFTKTFSYQEYREEVILREITKAVAGFLGPKGDQDYEQSKIITGNWGCGAFSGDHQLQCAIQWIAASMAKKDLVYCTFQDKNMKDVRKFVEAAEKLTIGELWNKVLSYCIDVKDKEETRFFNTFFKQV